MSFCFLSKGVCELKVIVVCNISKINMENKQNKINLSNNLMPASAFYVNLLNDERLFSRIEKKLGHTPKVEDVKPFTPLPKLFQHCKCLVVRHAPYIKCNPLRYLILPDEKCFAPLLLNPIKPSTFWTF